MRIQAQDLSIPLESLFDLSQEAQFVYDLQEQRIIISNETLEELSGYTEAELANLKAVQQLTLIHPDDHVLLAEHIHQLDQPLQKGPESLQIRVKNAEGQWIKLEVTSIIIKRNAEDLPILCLNRVKLAKELEGQKTLLTFEEWESNQKEYREKYERLEAKNQELKKINELLESFVFSVTHDLRTPVSNIKLVFELMDASLSLEDKLENVNLIRNSVSKLENTLSGLTEIIRIQNRIQASSTISFQEVLEKVTPYLSRAGAASDVQLNSCFKGCPQLQHIEPFVFNILKKLLVNAVQYAHPDRPVQINVSSYRQGDYVVLKVEDNGTGIDTNKVCNSLFKPFTRFTDKGQGLGVGLYIVKNLVESNGGQVKLLSQPGIGTTVLCFLREYSKKPLSYRL